jgi:NitT/TauT family transport system ATP-binding protein
MGVGMPLWLVPDESDVRAPARSGGLFRAVKPMHKPASAATEATVSAAVRPLAVDVRDVSLTFETADGKVEALSRVNLPIAEGEFVSFIGPSGCGKTTLLRLVADLEQPSAGMLLVNGVSAGQARLARAYGYIFQAPALYPWRTIEKNVMLPLEVMGFSASERRERAKRYLALVNLSGFERKFPWQLSGGMQQRASIARALSFDPALLLMDEPFGALDEIVRDHLNEQLLRLWDKTGKTVIFVTHSIPEAVFLSTKIVVMSPRPGRVIDVIDCDFARDRTLEIRETSQFVKIAQRVRMGLRSGHSYDE